MAMIFSIMHGISHESRCGYDGLQVVRHMVTSTGYGRDLLYVKGCVDFFQIGIQKQHTFCCELKLLRRDLTASGGTWRYLVSKLSCWVYLR